MIRARSVSAEQARKSVQVSASCLAQSSEDAMPRGAPSARRSRGSTGGGGARRVVRQDEAANRYQPAAASLEHPHERTLEQQHRRTALRCRQPGGSSARSSPSHQARKPPPRVGRAASGQRHHVPPLRAPQIGVQFSTVNGWPRRVPAVRPSRLWPRPRSRWGTHVQHEGSVTPVMSSPPPDRLRAAGSRLLLRRRSLGDWSFDSLLASRRFRSA